MGEVRKAQKPGRRDLLGINIAFPLKTKFYSLRYFHRYYGRRKVRIKVVLYAVWVCRKEKTMSGDLHYNELGIVT